MTGKARRIWSRPSPARSGELVYAHSTAKTTPIEPIANVRSLRITRPVSAMNSHFCAKSRLSAPRVRVRFRVRVRVRVRVS